MMYVRTRFRITKRHLGLAIWEKRKGVMNFVLYLYSIADIGMDLFVKILICH